MRHISNELSRVARFLAFRDGYVHEIANAGPTYQVLVLRDDDLQIDVDEDNTLRIQSNVAYQTIMLEGPIGTLIETSPDEVLEATLEKLRKYTVLDDLAQI